MGGKQRWSKNDEKCLKLSKISADLKVQWLPMVDRHWSILELLELFAIWSVIYIIHQFWPVHPLPDSAFSNTGQQTALILALPVSMHCVSLPQPLGKLRPKTWGKATGHRTLYQFAHRPPNNSCSLLQPLEVRCSAKITLQRAPVTLRMEKIWWSTHTHLITPKEHELSLSACLTSMHWVQPPYVSRFDLLFKIDLRNSC